MPEYLWEYSQLARFGDDVWVRAVDPVLRFVADDDLKLFRRLRGVIQIIVLVASLMIPASLFFDTAHFLTASGLLFDIAGLLRLFLFEETRDALSDFNLKEGDNIPSAAMSELIMPEAGPYDKASSHISQFYYRKRGVFFLVLGFALQLIGGLFA